MPGKVMPDHLAAMEIDNLTFYVRMYNQVRLNAQIYGNIREVLDQEKERLDPKLPALARAANLSTQLRLFMRRKLPRKIYRGILQGKRALCGPKNISLEEEEIMDEYLLG